MNPKSPACDTVVTRETVVVGATTPATSLSGSAFNSNEISYTGADAGADAADNAKVLAESRDMLKEIADDAFRLVGRQLSEETLAGTAADYDTLEALNQAARDRYAEVVDTMAVDEEGHAQLQRLNERLESYQAHLLLLERSTAAVEAVAGELDEYTRFLEESVRRRLVYPGVK
ncbi:hypothetical protein HK100_010729 [Physocladia obscura]|uniref:Biogenesis of lysosome-related organelles complex 1 subunit 2 n=1 Tax=Physocladia obscura TaxID=109957 RepID=A0AAD5T294_9FUNG|nr:hypothetical protein HK100_010729 [Physocladia obscura]